MGDGAGKIVANSPAPRFDFIDITTPAPPAQEGIRPRARSGGEEGVSERSFPRWGTGFAVLRLS